MILKFLAAIADYELEMQKVKRFPIDFRTWLALT